MFAVSQDHGSNLHRTVERILVSTQSTVWKFANIETASTKMIAEIYPILMEDCCDCIIRVTIFFKESLFCKSGYSFASDVQAMWSACMTLEPLGAFRTTHKSHSAIWLLGIRSSCIIGFELALKVAMFEILRVWSRFDCIF